MIPRGIPVALFGVALVGLLAASVCHAAETYVAATADTSGDLRIERAQGRIVVVPRDSDQVECDQVSISPDRRSVGWLALYPNCCTSYPIALKLRVYSKGHLRSFEGIGLAISRWSFIAGGRQVAFEQETVHGGFGVHYELRDVASGRLVGQYEPPPSSDGEPPSIAQAPPWVNELDTKR